MAHLEGIALDLGVRIEHYDHLPHGRWGEYRHRRREVRLLRHMAPVQYRSTLAHELGHAAYGHRRSTARTELEADAWASQAPDSLGLLETSHSGLRGRTDGR
ncbi:ImmA/IrrE family metallo-endopeptidase [Nesterenkonia ebinurensis]|uniref:ImmA/IrrE family metallo-endopeptidase n=1 Tax=Nesterenkonia ebinurensis TaxID=2608252 RepID=UPI00123CCCDB|nr:ImmA/IrrE family metallo-endopeptidase [Nesterenkonia ebinurensis]